MHERVLMSPVELAEMMKTEPLVLIDTRDAASFAEAHLPGAVNIHEIFTYLATSTPQGVAALRQAFTEAFGKAGLSGKETAVVYEQSMTTGFGQSCRGYVLLRYLGYPRDKIKVLHGGFSAWRAAALPSTTDVPAPQPANAAQPMSRAIAAATEAKGLALKASMTLSRIGLERLAMRMVMRVASTHIDNAATAKPRTVRIEQVRASEPARRLSNTLTLASAE